MQVGRSYAIFEMQVKRWHTLDRGLQDIAVLAAATRICCAWCLDFGYWEATMNHDIPAEKIRAATGWRDSDVFTEWERLVLDEMVARLREHLSEAELVELTALVAVENLRSRINSALGLTAQGFKDRCDDQVPGRAAAAVKPAGR